ncbi:MAG: agmatinase [Thaumarchaeota archaeon]|nr:agmatinase [Nitrososphaerota archaeon]
MSFSDLYLNSGTLITSSSDGVPLATIFGIPFDSTHSYKPGCRFGPDAIREAFNNIEIFHPNFGIDLEDEKIKDLGNLTHTVVVKEMIGMIKKIMPEILARDGPVIILGGEHSLTYATYTSLPKNVGYVVFDAHYDLRDSYAGERFSHAAYLRRIVEECGSENILHVGARAFVREEMEFLNENKIKTISDEQIKAGDGPELLKKFASSFDSVYVSVDLDVLDPGYAPGVGNPEAVGITPRELFDMIYSLDGVNIACADIVELNPQFDNGATSAIAAKIMSSVIAMCATGKKS